MLYLRPFAHALNILLQATSINLILRNSLTSTIIPDSTYFMLDIILDVYWDHVSTSVNSPTRFRKAEYLEASELGASALTKLREIILNNIQILLLFLFQVLLDTVAANPYIHSNNCTLIYTLLMVAFRICNLI